MPGAMMLSTTHHTVQNKGSKNMNDTETTPAVETPKATPTKPFRIVFQFAGGKYDLRIQANETDPNGLVLKSANPDAVDNLILLTGINPDITSSVKGSVYQVTFASKEGVAKLLAAALLTGLATKAEAAEAAAKAAALDHMSDDDDDVGATDDDNDDN